MTLGALIGDAISLGPHWIYDQAEIQRKIIYPDRFQDPISAYHPGKHAGDQTHYGDQILLLLKHLSEFQSFDLSRYADTWQKYWENPGNISYRDGSTKVTLANLENGQPPQSAGADSHDLAGAGKFAPLFLLKWNSEEALLDAVKALTAFTHHNAEVIQAADYFAQVSLAVQSGETLPSALRRLGRNLEGRLKQWLRNAEEGVASGKDTSEVFSHYGLSCNIDGGFSGVCHLLLKYPNDPTIALVENAMAGGDNAARGTILGTVYGALNLISSTPVHWTAHLVAKPLLEQRWKAFQ